MSLFNTLHTSVSGMAAQANALSVIGDNIANTSTTGYKEAQAQFETELGAAGAGEYESGGVKTDIRYSVTNPGTPVTTASATDLAIDGNGFFVVSKSGDNSQYLTRAGSFVPDSKGDLVNTAGYNLLGYKVGTSGTSTQLSVVNVSSAGLTATPSTKGTLSLNLNSAAAAQTAPTNMTGDTYSYKTSVTTYDNLGGAQVYDVYLTKTANADSTTTPPTVPTWDVSAYPQKDATNGGFPYMTGTTPDTADTTTLKFDPSTGNVVPGASGSATSGILSLSVPNGTTGGVKVDLTQSTQLTSASAVEAQTMDGNAASSLKSISVGKDGTVNAVYSSGATAAIYKVPLGDVQSADNLKPINGNVYQVTSDSGPLVITSAATGDVGSIDSNALEQSNVDLATELTNMISAQRAYEANSKVLQAASTLLGNLNQIQTN